MKKKDSNGKISYNAQGDVRNMKKLNYLLSVVLGFSAAGNLAAGSVQAPVPQKAWRGATKSEVKTETFKPVFSGDTIVCGNKVVTWTREGKIIISSAKGALLTLEPFFVYMNDQKKIDWYTFTKSECGVKTENGKVVWTLKKKLGNQVYDSCSQSMEITPEGLLKIRSRFHLIPAPGWKPRGPRSSIFIFLPCTLAEGKYLVFNGQRCKLDTRNKIIVNSWRDKQYRYVFYPDNAADTIALNAVKPDVGVTSCFPNGRAFRVTLTMNKELSCVFTLDLRKGVRETASPDKRGGIDFQAIEQIELPDSSRRNLLRNSSFESGLTGYRSRHSGEAFWEGKWQWKPFEVVEDPGAPSGKHVLRLDARVNVRKEDHRQLLMGANITTHAVVVPAGTYTVSFYAKGKKGAVTYLASWIPNFHSGSQFTSPLGLSRSFRMTDQWKRYSFTFKQPKAWPLEIHFNARSAKGNAYVLLDALQLETGDKATAYEMPPAEGRLVTSSPENFVSAKEKINGWMTCRVWGFSCCAPITGWMTGAKPTNTTGMPK